MRDHESSALPSFAWFALVWLSLVSANWGIVCLLALGFWSRELASGLVPPIVLFGLALLSIAILTMALQTLGLLIARRWWPQSTRKIKRFVIVGTTLGLWLCLLCLTYLAGGVDGFIPRL